MEDIFTAVYKAAEYDCPLESRERTCNYFDDAFEAGDNIGEATKRLNNKHKFDFINLSNDNALTQADWFEKAEKIKRQFIQEFELDKSVTALKDAVEGLTQKSVLDKIGSNIESASNTLSSLLSNCQKLVEVPEQPPTAICGREQTDIDNGKYLSCCCLKFGLKPSEAFNTEAACDAMGYAKKSIDTLLPDAPVASGPPLDPRTSHTILAITYQLYTPRMSKQTC